MLGVFEQYMFVNKPIVRAFILKCKVGVFILV